MSLVQKQTIMPTTAARMMGAPPKIFNKNFVQSSVVHPAKRHLVKDGMTMDEYCTAFNTRMHSQLDECTLQMLDKCINNTEFTDKAIKGADGVGPDVRAHDYGEFFYGQLTQVLPYLLMQPTRGISFMALPIVSINSAGKDIQVQSFAWNSRFATVIDYETSGVPQVQISPSSARAPIYDLVENLIITWNEAQAVAQAMASQQGSLKYDQYVGTFGQIAAKYMALQKGYLLALDNIAWTGSDTIGGTQNYTAIISNDGTNSTNGVPFVTATSILGSSAPATWNAATVSQKSMMLAGVAANVSLNSQGSYYANVLFVDLQTYLDSGIMSNEYKDTSPLGWVLNNKAVDAIIPVAAWNQQFPTKVTMFACFLDPQVLFFNLARPLVQTGVELQYAATLFGYRFRCGGITIVNALGTTQFQMDRGTGLLLQDIAAAAVEGQDFDAAEKEDARKNNLLGNKFINSKDSKK